MRMQVDWQMEYCKEARYCFIKIERHYTPSSFTSEGRKGTTIGGDEEASGICPPSKGPPTQCNGKNSLTRTRDKTCESWSVLGFSNDILSTRGEGSLTEDIQAWKKDLQKNC